MSVDKNLRSLWIGESHVDILGTAHVSRASSEEVELLLNDGNYDAVAIELCNRRYQAISDPELTGRVDLWKAIREKKLGAIAAMVVLGSYQQRLADSLGVEVGGEMKKAIALADEKGLPLTLIDRDIGITFKRLYRKVSWWRRLILVNSLVYTVFSRQKLTCADVEEMRSDDVLTDMFRELQTLDSRLYEVLIDERDRYMSARVFTCVSRGKPGRMLVVVGAGHLSGIIKGLEAYLRDGSSDPVAELDFLDKIPPRSKWIRLVPWIVVGVIVAGFVAGFSQGVASGRELVIDWILINGTLAGLGALLVGAHVLTILVAFLAAPLTSINPALGAGMVAAAAELYLRKPLVRDFENMRRDTLNWAGWWRNRITRILLVFLLTSTGSTIGTYIGGFHIYSSL